MQKHLAFEEQEAQYNSKEIITGLVSKMGVFAGSSPLGAEFSSVRYQNHGHISSRNFADHLNLGNVLQYSRLDEVGYI
jgi:hypothetical protein